MTSWVVWAVTAVVAGLIGFMATHFSVRTLRYVTAGIVIAALIAVTAYGQTPAGAQVPPDLQAAFALGADRLSAAWFRPLWALWSSRHAPAPGRLGWSVIAVTLLLGYRQGPHVLSHELREMLLDAARSELRTIRRQLSLPVIIWNTIWRRDERAVWRPHWRIADRQEFGDGVRVAELLVAVKHRLNQKYLIEKERAQPAPARAGDRRGRARARRRAAPGSPSGSGSARGCRW